MGPAGGWSATERLNGRKHKLYVHIQDQKKINLYIYIIESSHNTSIEPVPVGSHPELNMLHQSMAWMAGINFNQT